MDTYLPVCLPFHDTLGQRELAGVHKLQKISGYGRLEYP
jgi:hypothetical protein